MHQKSQELRVGTCGWCLPHNTYYQTFSVIEIQQTFYQPPQVKTVERWRREAPPNFEFTLKAFQAITHPGSSPTYRRSKLSSTERAQCGSFHDVPIVRSAWKTTLGLAQAVQARIVIFQCPASFRPTDENQTNLRRFFQWAERENLRFGWEPRGAAWTAALVSNLCRELDLIHVVDPFQSSPSYGSCHYFRLHGIGGYTYRYTDKQLDQLNQLCTAPLTYCMFNNTAMLDDSQRFRRLVNSSAE